MDIRADGVVAVHLGLEESTPLFYLERLRLADGLPVAVDRLWMPGSIGRPLLAIDSAHTSVYEQLRATGIPVTGGQGTVRAVIPSTVEHALLRLTPPSPTPSVERTATSHGVPIEWRQTLVRADLFLLTNTLTPQTPGGRDEPGPTLPPLALSPTFGG